MRRQLDGCFVIGAVAGAPVEELVELLFVLIAMVLLVLLRDVFDSVDWLYKFVWELFITEEDCWLLPTMFDEKLWLCAAEWPAPLFGWKKVYIKRKIHQFKVNI